MTLYALVLLAATVLFATFEHRPLLDSLWWAVVTAMTVGYGDISPASPGGRVVGILLMHTMVFLIGPMLIGLVINRMLQDRNAFTHEEQEAIKQTLRDIKKTVGTK